MMPSSVNVDTTATLTSPSEVMEAALRAKTELTAHQLLLSAVDEALDEAEKRLERARELGQQLAAERSLSAAQDCVAKIQSALYDLTADSLGLSGAKGLVAFYEKYGILCGNLGEMTEKRTEIEELKAKAEQRWATEWLASNPRAFERALAKAGFSIDHTETGVYEADPSQGDSTLAQSIGPHYKVERHGSFAHGWQPPIYEPDGILVLSGPSRDKWLIGPKDSVAGSPVSQRETFLLGKCAE